MFHHRALRTMIAATALVGLVALGGPTVASVDSKAAAAPSQRGPNNENYDPPMYTPTSRPVYDGTPANPLVREWGVRRLNEHLELRTRAGLVKPVVVDFFPAYDDDGGLLVALSSRS